MSGGVNSARRRCRSMHGRPSASVPTSAVMIGGTAIRARFRENGSPPLSARFAGRASHLTNSQNTVPEHVSTHQDDHNHQRHVAAFFVVEINSQTQDSMSKRKVAISKRRTLYPNARCFLP